MMKLSNRKDAVERMTERRNGGWLKRLGALALALCLLASMLPAVYAEAGESGDTVQETAAPSSAPAPISGDEYGVALISDGVPEVATTWDNIQTCAKSGTATEPKYVKLGNSLYSAAAATPVTGYLILDLAGYTITGNAGWVHVFDVQSGGSLTIMDSGTSGMFKSSKQPYSLVKVEPGGELTLNGGTLENNGGFHAIQANGGKVTINGGTIQNSGVDGDIGGAIYARNDASVEIHGGMIKSNKAKTGGAIYFSSSGSFTMTDGTIDNNKAGNNGGGLYFLNCKGQITFNGGTISNNKTSSGAHGGGMWFSGCPYITIGGETLITGNTACAGGGIRVQDGSTLTMTGGTISNNTATYDKAKNDNKDSDGSQGIGGGIAVAKGTVNIEGGTITGNKATDGGGGIALRAADDKTVVTMSGGTISGNEVTGGQWRYGGGVYLQDHSSFTMTGGEISGNHCKGQGGGISTDYSGLDEANPCSGDMQVTINGGTITKNYSELHEGGGIGMGSGTLLIEAKPGPVYIRENESRTTQHWGGGGIMISDHAKGIIVDALIEGNSAGGFGGGLGACSTGHVYYGVGADEGNPSPLAAIFGNTAQGTNLSGAESTKSADHSAYENPVFMRNGYQDVYSALEAVISGAMLGGGSEEWTGSADGAPVSVNETGFASASQMLGLTSNASAADRAEARAAASVFITGNHSNTHGGGIMCNGSLAMGWSTKADITPGLAIKGTKRYEVKGEKAGTVPEFHYAISNEEPIWVPDEGGTPAHWQAQDDSGVFTTTNAADGTFTFDLTFGEKQPCLTKTEGEQVFYFWEVNDGGNGMTYDPTLYKVTVKVSSSTSTKEVAGATVSVTTWSIVTDSAKVYKYNPATKAFDGPLGITQKVEDNNNSEEPMHWTTRTVVTLNGEVFKNTYSGEAKLKLLKVNEDGTPLAGAKFELYKMPDNTKDKDPFYWDSSNKGTLVGSYTSDGDGVIYADGNGNDLAEGVYRLWETEAPDGYKLLSSYVQFQIRGTGALRAIHCPYNAAFSDYVEVENNGLTLTVKNTLDKRPLEIVKYGENGEEPLEGAVFDLYAGSAESGTLLGTLKSGADGRLAFTERETAAGEVCQTGTDGKLTGLQTGTYVLEETEAPAGYEKLGPITFTVTEGGVQLTEPEPEGVTIEPGTGKFILKLTDPEMKVSVAFLKLSGLDDKPLAGAKFALYKTAEGADELLWTGKSTVANGKAGWAGDGDEPFPELGYGTYRLEETEAPNGFTLLAGPIEIDVDKDGKVTAEYNGAELSDMKDEMSDYIPDGTDYAHVFTVINESSYELPESGGMGTAWLYTLGAVFILTAALGLVCDARRRKTRG